MNYISLLFMAQRKQVLAEAGGDLVGSHHKEASLIRMQKRFCRSITGPLDLGLLGPRET